MMMEAEESRSLLCVSSDAGMPVVCFQFQIQRPENQER